MGFLFQFPLGTTTSSRPDAVVLDVGGWIGTTALWLAAVARKAARAGFVWEYMSSTWIIWGYMEIIIGAAYGDFMGIVWGLYVDYTPQSSILTGCSL